MTAPTRARFAPWLEAGAGLDSRPRLKAALCFENIGDPAACFVRLRENHWVEVDPLLPQLADRLEAGATPLAELFDVAMEAAPERGLEVEASLWRSLMRLARAGLVELPAQAG